VTSISPSPRRERVGVREHYSTHRTLPHPAPLLARRGNYTFFFITISITIF